MEVLNEMIAQEAAAAKDEAIKEWKLLYKTIILLYKIILIWKLLVRIAVFKRVCINLEKFKESKKVVYLG